VELKVAARTLGRVWLHEIKHDGFRVIARQDGRAGGSRRDPLEVRKGSGQGWGPGIRLFGYKPLSVFFREELLARARVAQTQPSLLN
jgi:hypothetical protein